MGVLNKKKSSWHTVPDNVDYSKKATRDFLLFACVAALLSIILLLATGCSTSRKVRKAYEKAAAYSPITSQDTANAFKISRMVVKNKPPKVIQGKTVIQKVPVEKIKKVLDTSLIAHIADSLTDVVLGQTDNYNDNIDGLIRDCNKAVRIALKQGYKQALDSFSTIQLPDDTIPNCEETEMELSDFQQRLRVAQAEVIKKTTESDIYRKRAKTLMWLVIALGIVAVLSIFFNVKKLIPSKLSK